MKTARVGDKTTGHPPYPPQTILTGSPSVLINGIRCAYQGSQVSTHSDGSSSHSSVIDKGSSTVYVGGIPIARALDPVQCGGVVKSASPNVEAN